MNLLQRIIEIRKACDYIQKDKSVSTGGGSYKAVTHDAVTGMLRKHMDAHGVVSWPVLVDSVSNPKEEGIKQFRYEATYDIFFANAEKPEDKICIRIEAHAMDNADKAPGKALSYAKKYAMLKLFEIETGEDEESRYNQFDIEAHLDAIYATGTLEELKAAHSAAVAEAGRDRDAVATLNAANKNQATAIDMRTVMSDERFSKALDAAKTGKFPVEKLKKWAMTDTQAKAIEEAGL